MEKEGDRLVVAGVFLFFLYTLAKFRVIAGKNWLARAVIQHDTNHKISLAARALGCEGALLLHPGSLALHGPIVLGL